MAAKKHKKTQSAYALRDSGVTSGSLLKSSPRSSPSSAELLTANFFEPQKHQISRKTSLGGGTGHARRAGLAEVLANPRTSGLVDGFSKLPLLSLRE